MSWVVLPPYLSSRCVLPCVIPIAAKCLLLRLVNVDIIFLSFWTLKILGIEQDWKPSTPIYVIVGHCWKISMLVYIFKATMYKKFLDTDNGSSLEGIIVTRTKTCLFAHQIPTFPIIITNIMTKEIEYHIRSELYLSYHISTLVKS